MTRPAQRLANIGPKGRRQRFVTGATAIGVGVVALLALLLIGVDRGWRVALLVPFWAGALGLLQAHGHT
jgi:hypothetical protein